MCVCVCVCVSVRARTFQCVCLSQGLCALNSCAHGGEVSQDGVSGRRGGFGLGKKRMSSILDMSCLNQELGEFYFRSTYICVYVDNYKHIGLQDGLVLEALLTRTHDLHNIE